MGRDGSNRIESEAPQKAGRSGMRGTLQYKDYAGSTHDALAHSTGGQKRSAPKKRPARPMPAARRRLP